MCKCENVIMPRQICYIKKHFNSISIPVCHRMWLPLNIFWCMVISPIHLWNHKAFLMCLDHRMGSYYIEAWMYIIMLLSQYVRALCSQQQLETPSVLEGGGDKICSARKICGSMCSGCLLLYQEMFWGLLREDTALSLCHSDKTLRNVTQTWHW